MSSAKCNIRIGTSGWHYNHWKGLFYPRELPKTRWLKHYAGDFDTVEINNTFYQLPKATTIENWFRQTPEGFLYTVKANRFITHIKKLKNAAEPLERFLQAAEILKEKLGPILYQLPPGLKKDIGLLENFIKLLPEAHISVFEFRNNSWYSDDVFELLDKNEAGFCVHDLGGLETPRLVTGRILYIRFHGPAERYAGNYTMPALKKWADWIRKNLGATRIAFAYFNNDANACAVRNAKQLKELLLMK
jgi:uncharacterized protein YecE (DUF72 family)